MNKTKLERYLENCPSLTDDYLRETHKALILSDSKGYYLSEQANKSDLIIRKTFPCKEYPAKPHFYIVKLGYAGVYLCFLFLLQNIDCGYSLEPPRRAVVTCTYNLCFEQK